VIVRLIQNRFDLDVAVRRLPDRVLLDDPLDDLAVSSRFNTGRRGSSLSGWFPVSTL
jgi:hypothetical protein